MENRLPNRRAAGDILIVHLRGECVSLKWEFAVTRRAQLCDLRPGRWLTRLLFGTAAASLLDTTRSVREVHLAHDVVVFESAAHFGIPSQGQSFEPC